MNATYNQKGLSFMRLTCHCTYPGHVIDFIIDDDDPDILGIYVNIPSEEVSMWRRVKAALYFIFGRTICPTDSLIEKKDVQELVEFFKDKGLLDENA